jgi:hypothetical protein
LVNYLIVLWNNAQPTKIFDDQEFIDKLELMNQKRNNKKI